MTVAWAISLKLEDSGPQPRTNDSTTSEANIQAKPLHRRVGGVKIASLAGQHIQNSQNTPNLMGREESRRSNSSDQTRLYRKLTRLKLIKLANTLSEYDTLPDRQLSNTCVGAHREGLPATGVFA